MKKLLLFFTVVICMTITVPFGYTQQTKHKTTQTKQVTVYITNTGSKYHRAGCRYLRYSSIAMNKKDAIASGYEPCKICNP